jgi:glycosyltransferase involved in cell wall biosynthesis
MRWLIVEDALRDRTGHWFEYVNTFSQGLRQLGDEVKILADQAAESFILNRLPAAAVLPSSIWHRMSDGAPAWRRYLRIPKHACLTFHRVGRWFKRNPPYGIVFVPTVLVHHMLGWIWLIKGPLRGAEVRIVLFFPAAPIWLEAGSNKPGWAPSPTSRLFDALIRSLKPEVQQGRVVLGAETESMTEALTSLTGTPFRYFPHPVTPLAEADESEGSVPSQHIVMAAFGGARHEKGEDVLISAIDEYTHRYTSTQAKFVLQHAGGRSDEWQKLDRRPNVSLISRYFESGEYAEHLHKAGVLLLPYRRSSYALRVSRMAVEAMVNGIPMVVTRGTTLASQAERYGAAVLCADEDSISLIQAIRECEQRYEQLCALARSRMRAARDHFSVARFRSLLCSETV